MSQSPCFAETMAKTDREAGDVELVESVGTDSLPSTVHVHPITSESTLVPANYLGTQQDKREMFTMGRAQQLRVSNSLLPPPASSIPFLCHFGIQNQPEVARNVS